jgi:CheY-like chemotaxis protein
MKGKTLQICMADDDADDYVLFSTILKEINNSVLLSWFATCIELIKYLNLTINLPDLIILDMNMPGNNGHECLQLIKRNPRFSNIPVVILSTASSPAAVKKAYECGAFKYLIKPHSMEGYTQVIEEILAIPKIILK